MKHRLLVMLLLSGITGSIWAQKTVNYKDMILDHQRLWALTTTGELRVFDMQQPPVPSGNLSSNAPIVALAIDRLSNIVIGDDQKHIKVYDSVRHVWRLLGNYTGTLYAITFNTLNECYLLTSKGVVDYKTGKTYRSDSSHNIMAIHDRKWEGLSTWYMDPGDDLWIGFNYGEWGGDLQIFDTRLKCFRCFNMDLNILPVQSICYGGGYVYVSTALCHFRTSGTIIRLRYYCGAEVFTNPPVRGTNGGEEQEYVGPAVYSKGDSSLYFYSDRGIFKGHPDKHMSKSGNWEKVAEPHLLWAGGQPMAVGSPMNVRKLIIADDGRLIFLSQLNGIGVVNGDSIAFLP